MVVVVASLASSSSRSLLSSSSKVGVFQRRRRRHHKIDRNSIIASVSRSWTSRTSVSVPLRDLDPNDDPDKYSKSSFSEYISDGSRILAVTFPDETRREQMTDTTWKVQVLCCVYTTYMECNVFRVFPSKRTFGETHTLNVEATA